MRSTAIQVAERLEASPQLILANELMDNLPFRRLRGTASGTKEVMVGLDGNRLIEHLGEPSSGDDVALGDGEEAVLPRARSHPSRRSPPGSPTPATRS